ncbi:MAG TPA: ATP-binding protein, partial [Candidatus Polarisedimenticolia bacterium]|nr:ATP-binding protein [Candidatus Polarisedimenticolia bacterium]
MSGPLRLLLVDDNPDDRALVSRELMRDFPGLQIEQLYDAGGLQKELERGGFDLVISDYQLRWTDGLAVLRTVKERHPLVPVVMFTATGSEEIAVEAMKSGLDDYVLKSSKHLPRLRAAVHLALERSRRRAALAEAESRYRTLFEGVGIGLYRSTPDGRLLDANPALARILGFPSREALMAMNARELWVNPEERELWQETIERDREPHVVEARGRRVDGTAIWLRSIPRVARDRQGRVLYYEGSIEDITEKTRAAEAAERLAAYSRSNPNPILEFAPDGTATFHNAAAESLSETLGLDGPAALLPPDTPALVRGCLATGEKRLGVETTFRDVTLTWSFIPVIPSQMVFGYAFDISHRLRLESQLRQAQKMEAIGLLAGGVAHDFSNLLTVIGGYCDLLQSRLGGQPALQREVEEIKKAGERAASMTRQLLAFSRKQVLQPVVLDLNEVVGEMHAMLRRLIGEPIVLRTIPGDRLGRVKADPGQVEQVIMNLVINARDAMPQGGHLTIETRDVQLDEAFVRQHIGARPGPHVMLSVSDTGPGMSAEVQAHIFEPFFTTKEPAKGTGMGLATVYGIVKQSGGSVWVHSEIGRGTTFKVFLPRVEEEAAAPAIRRGERTDLPRGRETILVVEDEPVLRGLVREILERLGYIVLEAGG